MFNETSISWALRQSAMMTPDRIKPSGWLEHIPFAFWLIDVMRPGSLVELGTWSGVSYSAFCQAVKNFGLATRCYAVDTWTGDGHAGHFSAELFEEWKHFHDLHYADFSFLMRSTFKEARNNFADASIQLLHIDGYHTYEAVSHDYHSWLPKLSKDAIVLFHDTNVRERDFGVHRLWNEISCDKPHFEFVHGYGLGVLGLAPLEMYPRALRDLFTAAASPVDLAEARLFFASLGRSIALQNTLDTATAERESLAAAIAQRDSAIKFLELRLAAALLAVNSGARALAQSTRHRGSLQSNHVDPAYSLVASSPLFDAQWYTATYPEVGSSGLDPVAHFLTIGAAAGLSPSAHFNLTEYLRLHPDVEQSGMNALLHFIQHGALEGRSIVTKEDALP